MCSSDLDHLAVSDHLRVLQDHLEDNIFDGIVINNRVMEPEELKMYKMEHADQILPTEEDRHYFREKGIEAVEEDLICRKDTLIRHDFDATTKVIMQLAQKIEEKRSV